MKVAIIAAALLAGCSSVQTRTEYVLIDSPEREMVAESTYKFYPLDGRPYYGELVMPATKGVAP